MKNNSSSDSIGKIEPRLIKNIELFIIIIIILLASCFILMWMLISLKSNESDSSDLFSSLVWSDLVLAIASSIVAAAVIYLIIQNGTEKIYKDIIRYKINENIKESRLEVIKDIKDIFNSYGSLSPSMTYPASSSQNNDLLKKYYELIESTDTLDYKGDKILFLADLLYKKMCQSDKYGKTAVSNLRIIIPDIANFEMIKQRAKRICKYDSYIGGDSKGIALIIDIIKSVCALLYLKINGCKFDFELRLYNGIDTFRTEIFDNAVLVSVLTSKDNFEYLPGLLYEKQTRESLFYAFRDDFDMTWQCCESFTQESDSKVITKENINDTTIEYLITRSGIVDKLTLLEKTAKSDWTKFNNKFTEGIKAIKDSDKSMCHDCIDKDKCSAQKYFITVCMTKYLWEKRIEEHENDINPKNL